MAFKPETKQAPSAGASGGSGGTAATVTIAAGESLSSAADLTSSAAVMMIAPPDWSPANITFQVSMDGTTFADLFDADGVEVLRPIKTGTAVLLDQELTKYVKALKIRSGPRQSPVVQTADRAITLVTALV